MTSCGEQYYTRWTPSAGGPYPLRLRTTDAGECYELTREPSKPPETYDTWKGLVSTLHGDSFVARHWTKDRYLGIGRHARTTASPGIIVVGPMVVKQIESLQVETVESVQLTILSKRTLGIDLKARGHEVAKLLYAGFHSWIGAAGYDFEDVLQEVYRKILVANAGKAPWDPEKSSFGHYVHLVCKSALSNFHRKQARISTFEQVGLPGVGPDGTWSASGQDVASANNQRHAITVLADPVADLQRYITMGPHKAHPEAPLAARLASLLYEGHTLKHAADILGVDRSSINRAQQLLRTAAAGWEGA